MTPAQQAEMEAANYRFLDRTIARREPVLLATPISQARVNSMVLREVDYLIKAGYVLSPSGSFLTPPD